MKRQYLGDSKDCFKWDYHDFLMSRLEYPLFNIALMMTTDDDGTDGNSHPALFPARDETIQFCQKLKKQRSINLIKDLPEFTGSRYRIHLHNEDVYLNHNKRNEYFSNINLADRQLVFLDPDNGFEPKKSINEKHVSYKDIHYILEQVSNKTVISVFQHHRRIAFSDDFQQIRKQIPSEFICALYWQSLMFVLICQSDDMLTKIKTINHEYSRLRPVTLL